eukprot:TRINITY_DN3057_c0_g1_i1.p1 TRINITY_DN3057_c0_g1~~TRINITY_DN3057_c0_g1_i1.p1  ORF type:complete len:120 (-),score=0.92 TRINITY_DN3057_c0_g1_i1:98-457(-)
MGRLGLHHHTSLHLCPNLRCRYGSGLSVRAALELVRDDAQAQHMRKLQDRDFISGAATMAQLDLYVSKVRCAHTALMTSHSKTTCTVHFRNALDSEQLLKMFVAAMVIDLTQARAYCGV